MKKYLLLHIFLFSIFQINAQTVSDVDGNTYNTLTIGTQVWMKENLKTTKYNDNTSIPNVTDNSTWTNLTTPAYCWYNNNATTYKATYGALYNWYTVNTGKLCPTGWHVPTKDEWVSLFTYLGGENIAGSKLKEAGFTHWCNLSTDATNSSGFTGLPGGIRHAGVYQGVFSKIGYIGVFSSATEYDASNAYGMQLDCNSTSTNCTPDIKSNGLTVRCLKDNNSIEQVTVTFNVDGGSAVANITATKNTAITKPQDPIKSGYTFAEWYKEAACANVWNFATDVVTADTTLYAKWAVISTGIGSQTLTDFKLYPNPAKDKLYIKDCNLPNAIVMIYDLQGKQVINVLIGLNPIDISILSKGIYIVKIIDSKNTTINKLIKE